jgi:hypothetical protein
MSATMNNLDDTVQREYILAEFRCALMKTKLAQLDIEAVALALKFDLVTPDQAAAMFWNSEAVQFLGLELRGAL